MGVLWTTKCPHEGYQNTGTKIVSLDRYDSQHEFEKWVSVDRPAIFFKAPEGRVIAFDDIKIRCPSGMAAYGNDDSVTLYDSKYDALPLFREMNGGDDFYVVVPVKKILDSITCLNGSVNTSASVKVEGRYHLELK
jgi:hypothetical protein